MDTKKKILAALGLLVVAGGAGFGLYRIFFYRPPERPAPSPRVGELVAPGAFPTAGEAVPRAAVTAGGRELPTASSVARGGPTFTSAVDARTLTAAALSTDGRSLAAYDSQDGKFYRITPEGTRELLSQKVFFNVQDVEWAPNRERAILEYPDGANIYYDFETDTQVTLPKHWETFDFSSDGTKIAAKSIGFNQEQNWLVVANPDGSLARPVEHLGQNAHKVIVEWSPAGQVVGFSQTGEPVGDEAQEIYLLGPNGENYKSLIVDGFGFEPKWSPTGEKLLYSTHSSTFDSKPMLWVVEGTPGNIGKNRQLLGLNTWADKCTFPDAATLVCAVPLELEAGAGYDKTISYNTPDRFVQIDLTTGLKADLATPVEATAAWDLQVTADGEYLIYTNKITGLTEKVQLK